MSERKIILERVLPVAGALGLLYLFGANHALAQSGPRAIPITSIARYGVWALPPGIFFLLRAGVFRPMVWQGSAETARVPLVGARTFISCCAAYLLAATALLLAAPHNFSLAAPFIVALIAAAVLIGGMEKDNQSFKPECPASWDEILFPSRPVEWRRSVAAGLAAFLAVVGVLSLLTLVSSFLYPSLVAGVSLPEQRIVLRTDLIEISLGVLFVPYLEEVLFRAGVIGFLVRYMGTASAVIVSAIFFSAIHMQNDIFLARLIGGLFMGALYVRTGSIMPSFVLHSALNFSIMFAVPLLGRWI